VRSLSIQVQPDKSPGIDMEQLNFALDEIAALGELVTHHSFVSGDDQGAYFNYTFGTPEAAKLWKIIQAKIYGSGQFGFHMRRASMAMCSSESGWHSYVLLHHFDPGVTVDSSSLLLAVQRDRP
jgi:hypothetical protein